jgi:hypothetical protein
MNHPPCRSLPRVRHPLYYKARRVLLYTCVGKEVYSSCLSAKSAQLHEAAKANLGAQLQLYASSPRRIITRLVIPRKISGLQTF